MEEIKKEQANKFDIVVEQVISGNFPKVVEFLKNKPADVEEFCLEFKKNFEKDEGSYIEKWSMFINYLVKNQK